MSRKTVLVTIAAVLLGALVFSYFRLTIFIVQPIGAIPEGRTIIASRTHFSEFIDSADAMCERKNSGVSLMCRVSMIATFLDATTIYARMPYSEWLYSISTDGKSYSR